MKYLCLNNSKHAHFIVINQIQTSILWNPSFDDEGNLVNENPNTTIVQYKCHECGAFYHKITRGKITKFFEGTAPELKDCEKEFNKTGAFCVVEKK